MGAVGEGEGVTKLIRLLGCYGTCKAMWWKVEGRDVVARGVNMVVKGIVMWIRDEADMCMLWMCV